MKRVLIVSVSGQDGAYLAKFLLEKGDKVVGTSRDTQLHAFGNARSGLADESTPFRVRSPYAAIHRVTGRKIPMREGRRQSAYA